ncbi:Cas1p-domain-containing protein [Rostrohypoxylon terebratum]|nr:Cas1p-domain-containing protein [Rostrohypoxylon terebratum]
MNYESLDAYRQEVPYSKIIVEFVLVSYARARYPAQDQTWNNGPDRAWQKTESRTRFRQFDPYRCQALLNDGAWSPVAPDGSKKWEPKNCRMVEYSSVRACLADRNVVFVGDSTIRQVFRAAVQRFKPERVKIANGNSSNTGRQHRDLSFEAGGVKFDFIWDPWLNSSKLEKVLSNFHSLPMPPKEFTTRKEEDASPALILLGAPGLWAARYGRDDFLDIFKRRIDHITPYISDRFDENMPWMLNFDAGDIANHILLAPVQIPEYEQLSPSRRRIITAIRIGEMNDYLSQLSQDQSSHIPWVYNKLSVGSGNDSSVDGLHVSDSVAAHKLDIAINAHCNTISRRSSSFKGTCCVPDHANNRFIWAFRKATSVSIVSAGFEFMLGVNLIKHGIFNAVRTIVIVVSLTFFYDRTTFLGKLERHYQPIEFIIMCIIWLVVSVFSAKKIFKPIPHLQAPVARPRQERNPNDDDDDDDEDLGMVSRKHSNEIKGLVQGFILLYHYHHVSHTLWIYKIIQLSISLYFFLTAYSHTMYFLRTNDFSFGRVLTVLFRLNFLSAVLSYFMKTDYSLYYFAPLISFWFLFVYGTLRIFREHNNDVNMVLAKVIAAAMITTIFISKHGILEAVAKFSHTYFNINWNVREMRFRLQLDRYVVFIGTAMAVCFHDIAVRKAQGILQSVVRDPSHQRLYIMSCLASLGIFVFFTQFNYSDKVTYNKVHPFISWVPIVPFLALRRELQVVKDVYLRLPAGLGQISLETFVLQYHVWLAGNATAKHTLDLWDGP